VIYRHKHIVLDMNGSKGKLYVNGKLRFMGDGYVAIKTFLNASDNHPDVLKMFQKQLEQREKPKFTQSDKIKREEPVPEEPKPKPKVKSESQRRSRLGNAANRFRMTR